MKKFNLSSEVIVSDPCYTIPTWCQAVISNVLPGKYISNVFKEDNRIALLTAMHEDFYEKPEVEWYEHPASIGVDSGQCGIFDRKYYRDDKQSESYNIDLMWNSNWSKKSGDDWYQRMCTLTCSSEQYGVTPDGVVSSSGYGDGSYSLLVGKIGEQIVGFEIVFISYDEDEEDED